jgi:hypothetical protein
MPIFNSLEAARNRLSADDNPLTDDELKELIPFVRHFRVGGGLERIQAEIAMRGVQAVVDFIKSSDRVSKKMGRLTWAILVLTIITTIATVVALFK